MNKQVRFIDREVKYLSLTIGKIYTVLDEDSKNFLVRNDCGECQKYLKCRFKITIKYPNPPSKHAELIKAWADGAEIEYYFDHDWKYCKTPGWQDHVDYRIKPSVDFDKLQKLSEKLHDLEQSMGSLQIDIQDVKHEIGKIQHVC